MKNLSEVIERVKEDRQLRPYFLDFIGKNIVLGMCDSFVVNTVDRARIQKEFYNSLFVLSEQLTRGLHVEPLEPIIEEVCKFYLGKIGRVTFDKYVDPN